MRFIPSCLSLLFASLKFKMPGHSFLTYYLTPMCSAGIQIWLGFLLLPNPKCSPAVTHSLQSTKSPKRSLFFEESHDLAPAYLYQRKRSLTPPVSSPPCSFYLRQCLLDVSGTSQAPSCPLAFVPLSRIHFPWIITWPLPCFTIVSSQISLFRDIF